MRKGQPFACVMRSGLRLRAAALLLLVSALTGWAHAQAGGALLLPAAIAFDADGNLLIADAGRHQVLEATLAGTLVVIAGTGTQGFGGDGGPAIAAELNAPRGIAVGGDGTIYVADTGNARIRTIRAGTITTFAGTGVAGAGVSSSGGDGGAATGAQLRSPTALTLNPGGALLVADTADQRVRRISNGIITTLAGTGVQGFTGDGGPATGAELDSPSGLAAAPDGRLFIADTHNQRVRLVAANGAISTYAGTGLRGFAGDGGLASAAALSSPRGLAWEPSGVLLIADADNQRVRTVSGGGTIATLLGSGTEGVGGDAALGAQAALRAPRAVAVSSFGFPAVAETLNGSVRLLTGDATLFRPAALTAVRAASAISEGWLTPQTYGQVRLAATVNGPVGTAHGVLSVIEGSTVLSTVSLANGAGTVTLPALGAGAHSLSLLYAGDGLNRAATAGARTLQVLPAPVVATAPDVRAVYGAPMPSLSGDVQGVLPQDSGEVTVLFTTAATAQSPVGSYPITASALVGVKSSNYVLDGTAPPGSLQIVPAGSTITLGAIAQSYVGLPLRLTADVASVTSGSPTGTVQFLDGATVVATGTLVHGSVSAVYVAPPAGTSNLSARYGGDTNFIGSASSVTLAQIAPLPDFGLSLSGSASVTVPAGNTAVYTFLVSAQPAPFTGAVVLSATGLPHGAVANFSPVPVIPGASTASVTLTVQTPAAQGLLQPAGQKRSSPVWACVLLVTGCGFAVRKRRRLLWTLALSVTALSVTVCGCGARTTGEGAGGLTATSFPLVITGTSTDLLGSVVTHTAKVTLIVEQ